MKYTKKYESFLDRFKKIEELEYPSKEELLEWIDSENGAKLRMDFRNDNQKFITSFFSKKKNQMGNFSQGVISQAIKYDVRNDEFILIYQGRVREIRYSYDNLILFIKQGKYTIDNNN